MASPRLPAGPSTPLWGGVQGVGSSHCSPSRGVNDRSLTLGTVTCHKVALPGSFHQCSSWWALGLSPTTISHAVNAQCTHILPKHVTEACTVLCDQDDARLAGSTPADSVGVLTWSSWTLVFHVLTRMPCKFSPPTHSSQPPNTIGSLTLL